MKKQGLWEKRFQEFLDDIRSRHRRPYGYLWSSQKFWSWFNQRGLCWERVDGDVFRTYVQELQNHRPAYAPSTIYERLRCAIAVVRHFVERDYLLWVVSPAEILKAPPRSTRQWVPEPEEVQRLLELPDPNTSRGLRDRAILELFYGSGLRLSEMSRLTLSSLDLHRGTVTIRDPKNGEDRVVPMTEISKLATRNYLQNARPELAQNKDGLNLGGDALWLGNRQRAMGLSGIWYRVQLYARQLELPISPHVLRHACATHLLQAGAGIGHIATLLGHTSLDSTRLYTHLKTMDLRALLERHHPLENREEFHTALF